MKVVALTDESSDIADDALWTIVLQKWEWKFYRVPRIMYNQLDGSSRYV